MDNKVVQMQSRKPTRRPVIEYEETFGVDRLFGAALAGAAALVVVAFIIWIVRHHAG
jgi:hypothetical protein